VVLYFINLNYVVKRDIVKGMNLKYHMHLLFSHLFQLSSISPVVLQLFPTLLAHVAGSSHPLHFRKEFSEK